MDKTINQLLAEKGITSGPAEHGSKALYRGDEFLGFFNARTAVERFLPDALSDDQQTCGDVIDRLPCLRCGAKNLRDCTLPLSERAAATTLMNTVPGLAQRALDRRDRMSAA